MAITLYSWPHSSGTRVAWALEELGLSYEYLELDPQKQEHRAPRYLAVNPHGKVPALVDGGRRFFESAAILLHLGDTYGVEKSLWPAADGRARSDALCWTVWSLTDLVSYTMQYLYHGLNTPFSYKPADRSSAAAEYNRAQLKRNLDALEGRLHEGDYLLETFSLVDVAAASVVALGARFGVALDKHPRTAAWCRRCTERPAYRRAR